MRFKKESKSVGVGKSIDVGNEVEVWNLASNFNMLKILKPMVELDKLEIISIYGKESIDDIIPYNMISLKRIEALERFRSTLFMLINNAYFVINKEGKEELDKYRNLLNSILPMYKLLSKTQKLKPSDKTETTIIDEKIFIKIFNILVDIKKDINTIFNNVGLIFRTTEDLDIDKIFDDFVKGG